jgi:DNA ligase-1
MSGRDLCSASTRCIRESGGEHPYTCIIIRALILTLPSSDLYKFKKWQDAEYTVESLDTSMQRLSVDSVYGEYEACSNVWIKHKGHPVSVGTGFSNEQRRRYAADPSLIVSVSSSHVLTHPQVGKQITVEYFAESPSLEREGVMSLRFPRVKQVWEEGERGV